MSIRLKKFIPVIFGAVYIIRLVAA